MAAHGIRPGDRHVYEHAAQLATDRAAFHLAAVEPEWLTALIGARPTDRPAAVQVWDDAVRYVAAHTARSGIGDPAVPIGPDSTDPKAIAVWNAISPAAASARVWLDTHAVSPATAMTRTRSLRELEDRRVELDAIFATAPADHRGLIDRLQAGGMLPLEDTTELLRQALAGQGERRRWILEHWPHVVEYAQITHILDHGLAGPDTTGLVAALTDSRHPHLAAAATNAEPWLITLAGQLAENDTPSMDAATEQLLADVAGFRHRWSVTGPHPLGDGAFDIDQAAERTVLTLAIDHALGDHVAVDDPWGIDRFNRAHGTRLPELDDTLGW